MIFYKLTFLLFDYMYIKFHLDLTIFEGDIGCFVPLLLNLLGGFLHFRCLYHYFRGLIQKIVENASNKCYRAIILIFLYKIWTTFTNALRVHRPLMWLQQENYPVLPNLLKFIFNVYISTLFTLSFDHWESTFETKKTNLKLVDI